MLLLGRQVSHIATFIATTTTLLFLLSLNVSVVSAQGIKKKVFQNESNIKNGGAISDPPGFLCLKVGLIVSEKFEIDDGTDGDNNNTTTTTSSTSVDSGVSNSIDSVDSGVSNSIDSVDSGVSNSVDSSGENLRHKRRRQRRHLSDIIRDPTMNRAAKIETYYEQYSCEYREDGIMLSNVLRGIEVTPKISKKITKKKMGLFIRNAAKVNGRLVLPENAKLMFGKLKKKNKKKMKRFRAW